jgi:uncharacterized protein YcfJ
MEPFTFKKGSLMNRIAIACVLAIGTAGAAMAQAQTFNDTARVRSVDPQYEQVSVPREQCSTQWVNDPPQVRNDAPSYGGAAIGGVAGGILGNQVGKGSGRDVATALGAVVGAVAGERIGRNTNGQQVYQSPPRQVTQCQTVNEMQTRLAGYRVTYDYRGQSFTTVMPQQPGPDLQVRVSVEPVLR